MKKILILGAGIYQVPLIKAAQRLGIHTIVCSIPGDYPGFAIADQVYYENTVDSKAILKIAKEENVDGIVTAGTDVCVPTIGKVCDELGLKGLSAEAAEISSNKRLMKRAYEAEGVRSARFREIACDDMNYAEKIIGLEFPLIFKAVDSSGSRGITRVDSEEEFEVARKCVLDNTRSDYYLIEEFIEGEEFGAQAFVQDGKLEFVLPHGDYVFKGNTGVPVGHFAPYNIPKSQLQDCYQTLGKAVHAMKLNNCAINADFILKGGKTYVLEIGGRSGATCLAELVAIYYGFDYYEKIIRVAMGEKVDFTSYKAIPNASKLLISDKDGVIAEQIDGNSDSNGGYVDSNIIDVQFDYNPGDRVHKFNIGPHRIGHVITKGSTLDEATVALKAALDRIQIVIE